jgi:hypothetical protein
MNVTKKNKTKHIRGRESGALLRISAAPSSWIYPVDVELFFARSPFKSCNQSDTPVDSAVSH